MNITILCVGKIKEKFYTDAVKEYSKRLSRFAELEVVEIPDESIPQNASEKHQEQIKEREGQKLLSRIKPQSLVIAMCIEGNEVSSPELAKLVSDAPLRHSRITFIIGGSLGLSDEVKKRADYRLSFGRITLPHQLMRVVLTEQIYRAYMISSGASYHK